MLVDDRNVIHFSTVVSLRRANILLNFIFNSKNITCQVSFAVLDFVFGIIVLAHEVNYSQEDQLQIRHI
jgi:hypothetical protein